MDGGDIDEVKQLLVKLAVIAEHLDARCRGALQRIDASATTLDRGARRWTEGADAFSRTVLETLGTQAHESIAKASRQALAPLDAQLREGAEAAKWAAGALAEQRKLLSRAQQALVRRGLLALLAGSMLAAGACGYVAWRAMRDAALDGDLRQAVRTGTLVRCPDTPALCARIGARPQRSGHRGEYLVLRP